MSDDKFLCKFPKFELDDELGAKVELEDFGHISEFDNKLRIISIEKPESQVEKTSEIVIIPSQNQSIDINQLLGFKAVPIASIVVNNIKTETQVKLEESENSHFNNSEETNQVEKTAEIELIPSQDQSIDINQLLRLKANIVVNKVKTEPIEIDTSNEIRNAETTEDLEQNLPIQCLKCKNWTENDTLLLHLECTGVVCPVCHKRFSKSTDYHEHALVHTKHKAFKCHLCFKCFKTDESLIQHCLQSHSINAVPYSIVTCPVCQRQFDTPKEYCIHYSSHCDLKPFQCPVCLSSHPSRSALRFHVVNIHLKSKISQSRAEINKKRSYLCYKDPRTREERFRCSTCLKVFDNNKQAGSHAKFHYVRKCNRCDQHFPNTRMLRNHIDMVHKTLAEKALICDECDQIFYANANHSSSFTKHLKCHIQRKKKKDHRKHRFVHCNTSAGIERYRCKTCFKFFQTKEKARSHMNDNRIIFRCLKCNLQFSNKRTYLQHRYMVHCAVPERSLICDLCEKIFYEKSKLKNHIICHILRKKTRSKPTKHLFIINQTLIGVQGYKCSTCNKKFETITHARRHQKYHNRLIFGCKKCNLQFLNRPEFRRHYVQTHDLGRKYLRKSIICDDCGKMFFHKSHLGYHANATVCRRSGSKRFHSRWPDLATCSTLATVSARYDFKISPGSAAFRTSKTQRLHNLASDGSVGK